MTHAPWEVIEEEQLGGHVFNKFLKGVKGHVHERKQQ